MKERTGLVLAFLAGMASLWFCSSLPGSHLLVKVLESSYPPVAPEDSPTADAIAVLAGTGLPRDHPLRSFETPNRMDGALALYQARRAPVLILTTEEGELNRIAAIERGVPQECILLTGAANNTAGEAHAIVQLARRNGWHRLLLVTSAFHMRRALLLLRRDANLTGDRLTVIPYPVDWQQVPPLPPGRSRWMPNQYGMALFQRTLKETVGILIYSL